MKKFSAASWSGQSVAGCFFYFMWYNRLIVVHALHDCHLSVWQELFCFIKPTPSSYGHAADRERYLRRWSLSASCPLLYTRRLAACRLPTLVHGQKIPMELWCYIGQASSGTVCLALTDTKQWVLFYCPGQGQAWYC